MILEYKSEHFKESYRTLRLESGFELTHYRKPFSLQAAFLCIDYGSLHRSYRRQDGKEVVHPMGSAHFLEHKLFENASEDFSQKMAKLGVSVNAYTGYDRTCFYFFGGGHFEEALEHLLKLPVFPGFTQEGVEKEKSVIAREIELYDDDIDSLVYRQAVEALYPGHPVAEEILGSANSLLDITYKSLLQIVKECYTPSRMQLLLIGDFEENILERVAEKLPRPYRVKTTDVMTSFPEISSIASGSIHMYKDISLPGFSYLQKLPLIEDGRERTTQHLLWEMTLESLTGAGSHLFTQQYAKGHLMSLHSYTVDLPGASFLCINGEGRDPEAFFEALSREMEKTRREGADPVDMERLKRRRIGERLRAFDQYAELSFHFFDQRRNGFSLFEEAELLFDLPLAEGRLPGGDWVYSVVSKECK